MTYKKRLRLFFLAAFLAWLPPPDRTWAGDTSPPEEYSRSGGGEPLKIRLAPAQLPAPALPKSLTALERAVGEDFLVMQRDNYLVVGDLGEDEYEYLVDGVLDYCSQALIRTFFDKGPVTDKLVNIFVFRDYDSYEQGLRRFLGMDPISPYGHYGHSQKYIVVNYETGPGTMVHELTHALMSEDFPQAPIWLAEGMASLYEHCRAEGDLLKGDDNWRLPELKTALERGDLTPLPLLLAMTPPVFRGARESLNYAQSRYFCKYLEELGLLSTVYKDFRDRFNQDPTGARFISKAFGKPLESVEASWKRWITFQYWRE
ncbi:MAG: hypothetical protein LIP77_03385 [Planctomycetes bacterium]|nr:hypothetical protein [Planctomycetota bacterium]